MDGLLHLGEHQPADLPVAQVRRQQKHALAPQTPLDDVRVAGHALDEPCGVGRRPRREAEEVDPRREVRGDHRGGQRADLRIVPGEAADDREVRASRAQILRARPVVDRGQKPPAAVHEGPREVAGRRERRRKPEARRGRAERPQERIPARHFFLHGRYPKRIRMAQAEGRRRVWQPLAAALPFAVFTLLALISWNRWLEPYVDSGRELMVPWRVSQGERLYRDVEFHHGPLAPFSARPPIASSAARSPLGRRSRRRSRSCRSSPLLRLARRMLPAGRAALAVSIAVAAAFFLRPGDGSSLSASTPRSRWPR